MVPRDYAGPVLDPKYRFGGDAVRLDGFPDNVMEIFERNDGQREYRR